MQADFSTLYPLETAKSRKRFLQSGTLGIAIDGLNEVDQDNAVEAFSRTFSDCPMLITSQQPGSDRFILLRLPKDIRKATYGILKLYFREGDASDLMRRIVTSGLESAIRSGYDAQLLVEIALNDPYHADLPMDRVGLYNKAIEVGWPDVPPNLRRDQQGRLMAAAWGMVSERKPNEDSTRLKPGNDLSRDLLEALADVPAKESKSIRLVRRVGAEEFEFVREQMQAYLAARWFTQDVFDLDDLERLVENSTVWMQGSDARRILWGFVSALLDNYRLVALLQRIEEVEKWDSLRRALRTEAIQRLLI